MDFPGWLLIECFKVCFFLDCILFWIYIKSNDKNIDLLGRVCYYNIR